MLNIKRRVGEAVLFDGKMRMVVERIGDSAVFASIAGQAEGLELPYGHSVHLGGDIWVIAGHHCGTQIHLAISAPEEVEILRGELLPAREG